MLLPRLRASQFILAATVGTTLLACSSEAPSSTLSERAEAIIEQAPKVDRQQACHGLDVLGPKDFAREAKWEWLDDPEVPRGVLLRALATWCNTNAR
jgi:hypothetical protein